MHEHDIEMQTRVAILEHQVKAMEDALRGFTNSHDRMVDVIHNLDKKLDEAIKRPVCPAAGLCLELEPKIASLEATRSEAIGGKKVLAVMMAAAGACGGLISWILGHFKDTH